MMITKLMEEKQQEIGHQHFSARTANDTCEGKKKRKQKGGQEK